MDALLVVLFGLGIGLGLLIRAFRPATPQPQPRQRTQDNLDTVDHMFLYGEVTGDDFYRM